MSGGLLEGVLAEIKSLQDRVSALEVRTGLEQSDEHEAHAWQENIAQSKSDTKTLQIVKPSTDSSPEQKTKRLKTRLGRF